VHTTPPAPKGIPVHPPIVVTHPRDVTHLQGPNSSLGGASAVPMGGAAVLPATVTLLTGAVTSPQNQGQTSTIFSLRAQLTGGCGTPCSATTYTGVTFQYRVGTAGTFANIPASAVSNGGAAVTWPVTTSVLSNNSGVQSPNLTWLAKQTISSSGLLQVQAVFTDGLGDSYTTSPVTVTLDRSGTGSDFATSQAGPVTVGLQSGNLSLAAGDVSIASYGAGLVVSRTFDTMAPGSSSLFGPGWTSSLPVLGTTMAWSSVTDGGSYAVLTSADGSVDTFAAGAAVNGVTSYTAQGPAAANGLALTKSSSGFSLTDPSGDQVRFTAANASKPNYYTPSRVTQPGSSRAVGYIYDATSTDAAYGKPLLMVAPNPNLAAGTSSTTACPYPASTSTWAAGCRGLEFTYDSGGKLTQVSFVSDDGPALTTTPVAAFSYDSSGRLSAEWDPRISPNLVTTYTYDQNSGSPTYGWLTSLSPAQSSTGGLAPWTFTYNTTAGSPDYGKLVSVTRTHSNGTKATQTIAYQVPLTTGAGGPITMDAATVGAWNQTDVPASATAVFPATHVPASPPTASDWQYAQITYYDANGRQVNTAQYGSGAWNIDTTQYDGYGDQISQLTAADRAETLAAGSSSASVAAELESVSQYTTAADGSQQLADSYGPLHNATVPGQGTQQVRTHTHYVYDQGAPSTGGPYDLVTTQTTTASLGAGIPGTADADARTTQNAYSNGTDTTGWTLRTPLRTITDPGGLAITTTTAYNEDSTLYGGEPLGVKTCRPSDTACGGAGTQQMVYYTAGANPVDSACGTRSAWADLVCKIRPAAQPTASGVPNLPVTTYTYNTYLEPLTKTEDFGSSTRTTTYTYDTAGRQTRMSIMSSDSGMTPVDDQVTVYSPGTGLVTDLESLIADIKSGYDDFGQLTSYTDAANNLTTYGYTLNGQVNSRSDGKGTTTFAYDTRELLTTETDSQAGTFTARYNPDGKVTSLTYPGSLTASYGYDETGTATSLSYAGQSWASPRSDSVTPDAHGDWATQNYLTSTRAYGYDNAGRLTTVQDTQAGQCTTRAYSFDPDSNRRTLTTYGPASNGACQTGTASNTQAYTYSTADQLITGNGHTYNYDSQGDITGMPLGSGGSALISVYYANGMLASQKQCGYGGCVSGTLSYTLDPQQNRPSSWNDSYSGTTYTNHYSDSTDKPAWTAPSPTNSTAAWTRYVTGPNGLLAATVDSVSGTLRTTLQLVDLHGDIMATASTSSASTGPTATNTYNEYGSPQSGGGGIYGWLGGDQRQSTLSGNVLLMGARAYNPATGRFDQVDPIYASSANAYDYAFQNPLTNYDLTGQFHPKWWPNWYTILRLWLNVPETIALYLALRGFPYRFTRLVLQFLPWWARQTIEWFINHLGGHIWSATEYAMEHGWCVAINFYIWGNIIVWPYYNTSWCHW
jgi:RHS repeat-associated protein